MTTTNALTPAQPLRPALDRSTAMRLAADENERFADAGEQLSDTDWTKPTDCTEWNVRQLVAHVVGMACMAASPLEMVGQQRLARKALVDGQQMIDALTATQVERYGHRDLVRLCRAAGSRAAQGRRRTPGLIRRRTFADAQIVNDITERWTIGFLLDVILTRDTWMHRIDLCVATGRTPVLTAEHDGAIVADVVAEWSQRHGDDYRLALTGPAGGTWSRGADTTELTHDAVEFCRTISGRGHGAGLLGVQVPF